MASAFDVANYILAKSGQMSAMKLALEFAQTKGFPVVSTTVLCGFRAVRIRTRQPSQRGDLTGLLV